ncbi:MAG: hypothetical protein MJE77_05850 [Proteobacteria bacterium]|nr:hypothetical protein [Pseudomonadota bacterium]
MYPRSPWQERTGARQLPQIQRNCHRAERTQAADATVKRSEHRQGLAPMEELIAADQTRCAVTLPTR